MSQPGSPTLRLLAGLAITLTAVALYSGYTVMQLHGLERLQGGILDRNRADSLLLLRIQNNLNSLGLAMRDMLEGSEPYPLTAWQGQFRRLRTDLEDAIARACSRKWRRSRRGAANFAGAERFGVRVISPQEFLAIIEEAP